MVVLSLPRYVVSSRMPTATGLSWGVKSRINRRLWSGWIYRLRPGFITVRWPFCCVSRTPFALRSQGSGRRSAPHPHMTNAWIARSENVHNRPLPSRDKAVPIPRERCSHRSVKGSPSIGKGAPSLGKRGPHTSVKWFPSLGKGVPSVGKANPIARKRGLRPSENRAPSGKGGHTQSSTHLTVLATICWQASPRQLLAVGDSIPFSSFISRGRLPAAAFVFALFCRARAFARAGTENERSPADDSISYSRPSVCAKRGYVAICIGLLGMMGKVAWGTDTIIYNRPSVQGVPRPPWVHPRMVPPMGSACLNAAMISIYPSVHYTQQLLPG